MRVEGEGMRMGAPCSLFLASQTLAVTPGASGSAGYQDGHQGQHQVKTPVHL